MSQNRLRKAAATSVRMAFFLWLLNALLMQGADSLYGAQGPDDRRVVTIGMIYDEAAETGEEVSLFERRTAVRNMIERESIALTRRDFDVRFPADKLLAGDGTVAGIRSAIDRLMADPEVDLIVSLGPLATNEIVRRGSPPKPTICAWALDIQAQALPLTKGASGVHNLNYLVAPGSIMRDLKMFTEVTRLTKIHVLIDSRFLEAVPEIPNAVDRGAEALGLELIQVPVGRRATDALEALPDDAEGVYLTPLHLTKSEFDLLIRGLIERRLPSFSFMGQEEVELGIMAGARPSADLPRLSRRIALNIQRVLAGEDAGTLPVVLDQRERLTINMATAQAIAVYPRWRVMIQADLIRDIRREAERKLTLSGAVHEAAAANLSLKAFERSVAAGAENIRRARSVLKPQIDAALSGLRVDEDRAAVSFGSQAERTFAGGLSLTQLIYSDGALANVEITRNLQGSLEEELQVVFLDVALDASTSFLNVLRAETLERIERDNLDLTESNLDLARRREQIGFSGPAEVYRWESRLATDRAAVIAARNNIDIARIALNRLLHRPLEERFVATPPSLADPNMVTGFGRLEPYIADPDSFHVFREFEVTEGLSNLPKLRAIDAAIAAQERDLLGARRSYWAPDVALFGDWNRRFSQEGAGSEPPPALPPGVPLTDRNDWSVGIQATLPLYVGGGRKADTRQATEELAQLRLEREALAEVIEQRIRSALFDAASTYTSIELSAEAADAAGKNLDLVTDAYSRGAVSIIDLLDAQNAALVADAFAANAVYDFLIDLMEVQRSSNTFDFFRSEEGREDWFERLRRFFAAAGKGGRSRGR